MAASHRRAVARIARAEAGHEATSGGLVGVVQLEHLVRTVANLSSRPAVARTRRRGVHWEAQVEIEQTNCEARPLRWRQHAPHALNTVRVAARVSGTGDSALLPTGERSSTTYSIIKFLL